MNSNKLFRRNLLIVFALLYLGLLILPQTSTVQTFGALVFFFQSWFFMRSLLAEKTADAKMPDQLRGIYVVGVPATQFLCQTVINDIYGKNSQGLISHLAIFASWPMASAVVLYVLSVTTEDSIKAKLTGNVPRSQAAVYWLRGGGYTVALFCLFCLLHVVQLAVSGRI